MQCQLIKHGMGEQTAFDLLVASVSKQVGTVVSAPIPFAVLLAILAFVIWRVLNHYYDERIASKNELLVLRDAQLQDYKDKLRGATPDEAKARMDALASLIHRAAA